MQLQMRAIFLFAATANETRIAEKWRVLRESKVFLPGTIRRGIALIIIIVVVELTFITQIGSSSVRCPAAASSVSANRGVLV